MLSWLFGGIFTIFNNNGQSSKERPCDINFPAENMFKQLLSPYSIYLVADAVFQSGTLKVEMRGRKEWKNFSALAFRAKTTPSKHYVMFITIPVAISLL